MLWQVWYHLILQNYFFRILNAIMLKWCFQKTTRLNTILTHDAQSTKEQHRNLNNPRLYFRINVYATLSNARQRQACLISMQAQISKLGKRRKKTANNNSNIGSKGCAAANSQASTVLTKLLLYYFISVTQF